MASRSIDSRARSRGGLTLTEALIAIALLAVLAATTVPALGEGDERRLEVAASEVRETLRFARAEAMRRGKRVLVDAESSPGCLKLFEGSCTSFPAPSAIADPRTKRSFVVDVSGSRHASSVAVSARFLASGVAYGGLLFDATGAAVDVCEVTLMQSKGAPQSGSGVTLSLGTRQVAVALDPSTGRVAGP
jgi:Tfp pilus assembly protein FimT